ncbi:hypothetical protein I9X38_02650 [Bacillus mojavensis]|nr:hypothetical protein I9X38_02650 [Bacillus mojavensis]
MTGRRNELGSGLPQTEMVQQAVDYLLVKDCLVMLDGCALTKRKFPKQKGPVIRTPHPWSGGRHRRWLKYAAPLRLNHERSVTTAGFIQYQYRDTGL